MSDNILAAVNDYFDHLVKSRFVEMFGDIKVNSLNWPVCKMGDIFNLQMGKTPSRDNPSYWNKGNYGWVSISDLSSVDMYIDGNTREKITDLAVNESGIKLVPEDTVLMSFKLSIGKTAITTKPMYTNEAIMALVPNNSPISSVFLSFLIRYWDWTEGANKAVKGVTLNKSTMKSIALPIPPIELQNQFADFVKQVDKSKLIFQQMVSRFDELVKSRFIEMFGSPIDNSNQLPLKKLSQLGLLERGVSKHRPRNDPVLYGGDYPLIQTGDVANCDGYITSYTQTYNNEGLKQSRLWHPGVLCITIAANIAKTGILTIDACFPDSVVGFTPNSNVNVVYIHHWFNFIQEIVEQNAPQSAQKNINLEILRNLDVICPSIDLQNQFADFVKQVDKSKSNLLCYVNTLLNNGD